MSFLYGVIGTVVVLILFFGGGFAGWKLRESVYKRMTKRTAQELTESERRRLKEQQDAFVQLQNYNADTAYGWKPQDSMLGGDRA